MSGYVAEYSGVTNNGGSTTTVTLSGGVPVGDSLVIAIVTQKSSAPVRYATVSDTHSNTWRFVRSNLITGTDTVVTLMYSYIINPLSSGNTITVKHQAPIDRAAVSVVHFNDPLTADVGNEGDNGGTASATLVTAATATTADASELVFGMFGLLSASRIFTATNGFTGLTKVFTTNGSSDRAIVPEYKYVGSTGTYTANGTLDSGSIYGGIVQTFRLAVPADTRYGRPKVWDGGSWNEHDAKTWNGSSWDFHRVKGRVTGDWVGPYGSGTSVVFQDTFDAVPIGVALNVGNTKFMTISGSAPSTQLGIAGLHGNAASFTVSTSDFSNGVMPFSPELSHMYLRVYFRCSAYPSGNTGIMTIRTSGGTTLANIQLSTTGRIRVRNGSTLVATSTNPVGTNSWVRLEWHWNGAAGSQDFRLFLNPNVEGTTADETLSSLGAVTGFADRITIGIVDATTSLTIDIDELAIDGDKWVSSK